MLVPGTQVRDCAHVIATSNPFPSDAVLIAVATAEPSINCVCEYFQNLLMHNFFLQKRFICVKKITKFTSDLAAA
jgi:hypothetical protein